MDGIQTHHGRATPVATGIKRANPDSICIAYMGDGGGYAIGAQHLVNAAGRNERITVLLAVSYTHLMEAQKGDSLPVSAFADAADGTFPLNCLLYTSRCV